MILAIDTTTTWGSVALATPGGDVVGEVRLAGEAAHSRTVLPAVDFLLRMQGQSPADVSAYAAVVGPGSFTGLRVGISTIQGLALAAGRPCIEISTLDALAARMKGAAPHLVPMLDAFRGEVFGAVYDGTGRLLDAGRAESPQGLLARVPPGSAFLGGGALKYRAAVVAACPGAVFPERSLFLAGTVARLASPRLAAGETVPAAAVRALYLRSADIWRPGGAPAA